MTNIKFNPPKFYAGLVLLILFMASACNLFNDNTADDPYNGLRTTYRKDGTLKAEVEYKDSLRHGVARNYYPNGKVKIEMFYEKGVRHGLLKYYYENGDLYQETTYVSGKIEGIEKKYYKGGALMAEIPYKNDKPTVGLKEYNEEGKLITNDVRVVFNLVDKTAFENKYDLEITLSDNARNASFSRVIPSEKGSEALLPYDNYTTRGKAVVPFYVSPGRSHMEEVIIRATRKTRLNHVEIFEGKYNLAIENRKRFQ